MAMPLPSCASEKADSKSRPRVLISKTRATSVISGAFVKTLRLIADEMVKESGLLLKLPLGR